MFRSAFKQATQRLATQVRYASSPTAFRSPKGAIVSPNVLNSWYNTYVVKVYRFCPFTPDFFLIPSRFPLGKTGLVSLLRCTCRGLSC